MWMTSFRDINWKRIERKKRWNERWLNAHSRKEFSLKASSPKVTIQRKILQRLLLAPKNVQHPAGIESMTSWLRGDGSTAELQPAALVKELTYPEGPKIAAPGSPGCQSDLPSWSRPCLEKKMTIYFFHFPFYPLFFCQTFLPTFPHRLAFTTGDK